MPKLLLNLSRAADASSHLFFAYLRSLEPESLDGFTGINALPRSLQALAAQTEYPPQTPTLLQRKTPKVVMLVDSVSPGPFALLRRAKHFEYRDEELQVFAEYPDPVQALTEECRRVLNRIAAANQSTAARSQAGMNLSMPGLAHQPDESWSRFQDFGFSDFSQASARHGATSPSPEGLSSVPRSRATNKGRPTTPSWADFLNSGFADEAEAGSTPVTLLLPPDKVLPPIGGPTSPTLSSMSEEDLEPGELASIAHFDLDDTFWWVWITSLANEEPSDRKAVFGRCALVETGIMGGRWLLMEEQVKGAAPEPQEAAYIAEKKSRFGFSRRNKATRRRSGVPAKSAEILQTALRPASASPRSGSVTSDQQAKIKAAAAALAHHSRESERDHGVQRRGRHDEAASVKTNSVMTLGLTNEAVPAMKWARDFDREAIRKQYLGNDFAGKGSSKETTLPSQPTVQAGESASAPLTPAEQLPTEDFVATLAPEKDKELQDVYALPRAGHTQPGASAEVTKADPVGELTSAPAVEPLTASESPSPAASPKVSQELPPKQVMPVERKPAPRTAPRINNIHDHPAFRAHNGETGLAERAARQAWGTESKAFSSVAPKAAGQGGFRKLFGKRRDDIKRTSISGPSSVASLQPPSESNLGRKLSLMRKKTPTSPPPDRDLGEPTAASHASLTPEEPYGSPNDSNSISHVGSQDQADAEHAFSRFDQGPLTDAPAFTPRESIDSSASLDSDHGLTNLDHVEAPGAFPETPMEYPSPVETGGNGYTSETSQPGADRWAQIKKNAAERAARMSEDQQSRPSHSVLSEKTDDGETSGEESKLAAFPLHDVVALTDGLATTAIEARVARIKARVAELTGNYEPQTNGVRR